MGRRIREYDWTSTPLGPPESWPQPLRFALGICLGSEFPTAIYWGPELRLFYNDAWAPIPAERHPGALGQRGQDVWPEIWDVVGPQFAQVIETGQGFATYDQRLDMERGGVLRETYWNYSFTPIRDEYGQVCGILNQGNETTQTVLSQRERRAEIERLRDLFQQSPGAVAVVEGVEHRFALANPAYHELCGRRDLVGRTVAEALPEVVEQGFVTLLDQVFASGIPFRANDHAVVLTRDGQDERRILDFVYQPIKDGSGATQAIFVVANDVTERRSAEQAARKAAAELQAAIEDQAFLHDLASRQRGMDAPDAILRLGTEALVRRLGIDRVGFYRVTPDARVDFGPCVTSGRLPTLEGAQELDMRPVAAIYSSGVTLVSNDTATDSRLAGSDVPRFSPAAIGVPLTRGGVWVASLYANQAEPRAWRAEEVALVEAVAQSSWDAVERAAAVIALRESEAKFRAIANSIDPMVWSTLPDGHHDYFNDRWYEFTGVAYGSTDGAGWSAVFHPEDQPRANALWHHSLTTGDPYHIEYRLRHRSGAYRWVLGRAQPVRDDGGTITRWFGTCTDIQDIVDAREVLARSREELEEAVEQRTRELMVAEERLRQAHKMEAVGQLTGGIAHDFNNMLAVIIGSLDMLERRIAQGASDLDRYIVAARDGATRAAALTQRLLGFARQQPLAPVPLDLNTLVSGMIDLLIRTLGEKVTVETRLHRHAVTALADPNLLENVVLNLSVNARDAMPDGGTLRIETAMRALDAAAAAALGLAPGDYVALTVADTGSGMSDEVAARAFDPFFTTKGVGKGTGLGLSQVFGFARQSGGHVGIDTAPGRGTRVTLLLPRHDAPTAAPAASDAEPRRHLGSPDEVILVVEDEERVRHHSVEALRELGYTVLHAPDGIEALRIITRGQRITLLFTDIVMPEMTGDELARRARAHQPDLKILYTSGYTPDENAITQDAALTDALLPKPFGIDLLAARVRAALDG